MTHERTALVTGASSGIGRATAEQLAREGFRVFGTSRGPADVAPAPGVELLELDVDRGESVRACVDAVMAAAGRIDLLVNNAGYVLVGAIEEVSPGEARALFDTNVFGTMRMAQAVIPHMRPRRRGRIINIGSLSATVAVPFGGVYSGTKRALQGISEAMRHELRPFGIDVCLVEATFIDTGIGDKARLPARPLAVYERARTAAHAAWRREIAAGPSVNAVAERVAALARARRTRFRYAAGFEAWWMPLVRPLAPWWLVERMAARRFDLHTIEP